MTTEDDIRRRREELKEDASARQRRAADPAYSIWVSASAGTGKTKVLTDRVLRLLLAGIVRQNGHIVIPSGNDVLHPYDDVIVVTTDTQLDDLRDILQA